MNVVDLPRPTPRSAYDEAATRYARMVEHRATAVYRVGNARFPGLSDLDILVVVDKPHEDNIYYFSPAYRLPKRLQHLFLHQPLILPAAMPDILQYTSHGDARLVCGKDVLNGYTPVDSNDERWCRILESACSYTAFSKRARERQVLSGRWTIAVTSALRFLLKDLDAVAGTTFAGQYAREHDELRSHAFENSNLAEVILQAWQLFDDNLEVACEVLRRCLRIKDEDLAAFGIAALSGRRDLPVPADYIKTRFIAISAYHAELARLRFPFGFLFFVAAYPDAVRPLAVPIFTRYFLRNLYRIRRRIGEYVYA